MTLLLAQRIQNWIRDSFSMLLPWLQGHLRASLNQLTSSGYTLTRRATCKVCCHRASSLAQFNGNFLGPFRADLMQKWFDDGYFSAELLMRRANLDTEWTTLGELGRRAGGRGLFHSPAILQARSFTHRNESPLQEFSMPPDQNGFKGAFQSASSRSLNAALDSYVGTG